MPLNLESRFVPTPRGAEAAPLFSFCPRKRGEHDALDVSRGRRHAIAGQKRGERGVKVESLKRMQKQPSRRASEGDVVAAAASSSSSTTLQAAARNQRASRSSQRG